MGNYTSNLIIPILRILKKYKLVNFYNFKMPQNFKMKFAVMSCNMKMENFFDLQTYTNTRNTLDCGQSNYSSRIVFSHIPTEFGHTGNSAIRSPDPENPILEPNTE